MKKKGLSAKQVQEICLAEGITLEEYYKRSREEILIPAENIIHGPGVQVLTANKQKRLLP